LSYNVEHCDHLEAVDVVLGVGPGGEGVVAVWQADTRGQALGARCAVDGVLQALRL